MTAEGDPHLLTFAQAFGAPARDASKDDLDASSWAARARYRDPRDAYSLDLELFAYLDTSDWDEFLAIREDLMLQIIEVVEASGTGFVFPSQTLYVGKDAGLDAERRERVEADVRSWREAHGLSHFPRNGPVR
jgi:hypothetical protein